MRGTALDLMIVPCPHRGEDWALVNRRGDLLATGDYGHCSQRLRSLTGVASLAA